MASASPVLQATRPSQPGALFNLLLGLMAAPSVGAWSWPQRLKGEGVKKPGPRRAQRRSATGGSRRGQCGPRVMAARVATKGAA